eukprot:403350931
MKQMEGIKMTGVYIKAISSIIRSLDCRIGQVHHYDSVQTVLNNQGGLSIPNDLNFNKHPVFQTKITFNVSPNSQPTIELNYRTALKHNNSDQINVKGSNSNQNVKGNINSSLGAQVSGVAVLNEQYNLSNQGEAKMFILEQKLNTLVDQNKTDQYKIQFIDDIKKQLELKLSLFDKENLEKDKQRFNQIQQRLNTWVDQVELKINDVERKFSSGFGNQHKVQTQMGQFNQSHHDSQIPTHQAIGRSQEKNSHQYESVYRSNVSATKTGIVSGQHIISQKKYIPLRSRGSSEEKSHHQMQRSQSLKSTILLNDENSYRQRRELNKAPFVNTESTLETQHLDFRSLSTERAHKNDNKRGDYMQKRYHSRSFNQNRSANHNQDVMKYNSRDKRAIKFQNNEKQLDQEQDYQESVTSKDIQEEYQRVKQELRRDAQKIYKTQDQIRKQIKARNSSGKSTSKNSSMPLRNFQSTSKFNNEDLSKTRKESLQKQKYNSQSRDQCSRERRLKHEEYENKFRNYYNDQDISSSQPTEAVLSDDDQHFQSNLDMKLQPQNHNQRKHQKDVISKNTGIIQSNEATKRHVYNYQNKSSGKKEIKQKMSAKRQQSLQRLQKLTNLNSVKAKAELLREFANISGPVDPKKLIQNSENHNQSQRKGVKNSTSVLHTENSPDNYSRENKRTKDKIRAKNMSAALITSQNHKSSTRPSK